MPETVAALALRKASAVAGRVGAGFVVAADTVVVIDDMVLGKPAGPDEARAMLVRLRGRQHEVLTGVGLVDAGSGRGIVGRLKGLILADSPRPPEVVKEISCALPMSGT